MGKVRYGRLGTACDACISMAHKKGVDDLEPYRCWYCNGWHIGHKWRDQ